MLLCVALAASAAGSQPAPEALQLSRPARPWEFLPVAGRRAALFGNEAGALEAWVYPLKLFRNFHLKFHVGGEVIPAESLARTVTVRPESATILYASDTFHVQETLFVPVNEQGAAIFLNISTTEPVQVEAFFVRDFTLEWPASLGGTYMIWDPVRHAFSLGEESKKFFGLVGSQAAVAFRQEYATNYSASDENSFTLAPVKGQATQLIVIAGSVTGTAAAENTYKHLGADYAALLRESAEYYRRELAQTINLELPDLQLQQAYDWARISLLQGIVTSPYLGTGLVAGYRTSGESQRPGFAWYFGRDTEWSSFALDAEGDFAHARQALDFISRYQRADGKIPHEISQTATFVDWFHKFPYPWASADATPLFIIAVRDYVQESGDVAFASEKWSNLWKAYQFLHSTWDVHGFAQNLGVGHGWVEGGPLRPPEEAEATPSSTSGPSPQIIKTEFYQSGLGIEALRALADLARVTGHTQVVSDMEQAAQRQLPLLNQSFWDAQDRIFAFGLDPQDRRIDVASILATVPMWFQLLNADKSERMINRLATPDFEADWGARIISGRDPRYDPGGYHYGSVWPLFTGWASVGEYRYHRALPAYANLRANALLGLDGSLGHVTEVLSGDYYQGLSTASPHQIWSAAMVVSPLLLGMMGLQAEVPQHTLVFAPHVPTEWNSFQIGNERAGPVALDLAYRRTDDEITLQVRRRGRGDCTLEFSPAVSLRAQAVGVEVNGRPAPFRTEANSEDQHVRVRFAVFEGDNTVRIHLRNDFGLDFVNSLPWLGARSRSLKFISQSWNSDRSTLTLHVAGIAGEHYDLALRNPRQVASLEGGEVIKLRTGASALRVSFPPASRSEYENATVIIHLVSTGTSATLGR